MQELTLPRTGQSPIAFTGVQIFHEISPASRREQLFRHKKGRKFEITVYKTAKGRLVCHVAYRFWGPLPSEAHNDEANVFADDVDLMEWLESLDPKEWVVGYPVDKDREHYLPKQMDLMAEVDADWESLLEQVDNAFAGLEQPERVE